MEKEDNFYHSHEWRDVRYRALIKYGRKCMACGQTPPAVIIHVDHIKPRSKYPHIALDINNLQILCESCNLGKSYKYEDDFREKYKEHIKQRIKMKDMPPIMKRHSILKRYSSILKIKLGKSNNDDFILLSEKFLKTQRSLKSIESEYIK